MAGMLDDHNSSVFYYMKTSDSENQLTDVVMSEAFRHEFVAYM